MQESSTDLKLRELAKELENDLLSLYGPILQGESLRRAMGYRTVNAVAQAIRRGSFPVPVMHIENRRGQYALAKDVAKWLAEQRMTASN